MSQQENPVQAIITLKIIFTSLSAIGSSTIIILTFRLGLMQNLAWKLITYISIGDLIFSLSNFIYISPGQYPQSQARCITQAFFIQFSEMTCFVYCFILCLCIYRTVIKNRQLNQSTLFYLIFGFGIPFLFALIPLVTKVYGTQIYVCALGEYDLSSGKDDGHVRYWVISGLFFYLPLWGLGLTNIWLIMRVAVFIYQVRQSKRTKSNSSEIQFVQKKLDRELELSQQITLNMIAYPIIMLLCWSGSSIYACSQLANNPITGLQGVRYVMNDCYGLLNSIAYLINSSIILKLRRAQSEHIVDLQQQMREIKSESSESNNFGSFISIEKSRIPYS